MTQPDGKSLYLLLVEYIDAQKFEALIPAHRAWLIKHYENGTMIVSGGIGETPTGRRRAMALFFAESQQAAEALVAAEPFFAGGACIQEVRPFVPRMHSPKFGNIFAGAMSEQVGSI
jgi:uncharacterized protein YciI